MMKLIKYDLINGGKKNAVKFCAISVFAILVCHLLSLSFENKIQNGLLELSTLSYGDYIVYFFSGMKEFVVEKDKDFVIPFIWMAEQLLICSLVFTYPIKDISEHGTINLLQYGSRTKWWLSKCIWSIFQVICYYIVVFLTIAVYTIFRGRFQMSVHSSIFRTIDKVNITVDKLQFKQLIPIVLYSIFMVICIITVSLIISRVIALLVVCIYNIVSVFLMNELLLANASMLYRNSYFIEKGINVHVVGTFSVLLSVLLVIVAIMYFGKYDIFQKKRD